MTDTTRPAAATAVAGHCTPAWDALIRDPERMRTIQPLEVLPIFQGMMRGGCKACPTEQTKTCQNIEKPFTVLGHDVVKTMFAMPWDFKAEDIIAGGASDASVRHADLRRVIARVEELARSHGSSSVTLSDLVEGLLTLAGEPAYYEPQHVEPAFDALVAGLGDRTKVIARGRADSRARAMAFRADPAMSRRNAEAIKDGLPHEARVHDALARRELHWCSHVPHLFTRLLTRIALSDEELAAAFSAAEAVARERGHSGVTPRDVETSLVRAAVAGLNRAG